MSKTKRKYLDKMCMKANADERNQKRQLSLVKDLNKEEKLKVNHKKDVPESYDDRPIAALSETKYIWKNGVEIKKEDDFYNIYFSNNFVVNLNYDELKMFPWTNYLPIDEPPNLSNFELV